VATVVGKSSYLVLLVEQTVMLGKVGLKNEKVIITFVKRVSS
jgi:hypothetical protein